MKKNNITDMTKGSPSRLLLRFMLPLLFGNLFQLLYNMVDSVVVGNYVGKEALAAIGACTSLTFLFFSFCNGFSMGIGVIVAQQYGARNDRDIIKTIGNTYSVLTVVSITISVLGYYLTPFFLRLLNTPEGIFDLAVIYMRITCIGLLGVTFYNGLSAILRALGDSKTPLLFLILASIINLILDLVLVICFHMGVAGAALATSFSQALSAILCIFYSVWKIPYFRTGYEDMKLERSIIKRMVELGIPMSLQSSLIAISTLALQAVVNSFGADTIAAFTITTRIEQVIQQPYISLAAAITTFTGQNIGAKKIERVKKGFQQSIVIVLLWSILFVFVMFLGGHFLSRLFVKDNTVITLSAMGLRIDSLFYFSLGMIYVPRAIMNGSGDGTFAMINGITEVVGRVGFSQLFIRISFLGAKSIWLTSGANWTFTAIICILRYMQGKWKKLST